MTVEKLWSAMKKILIVTVCMLVFLFSSTVISSEFCKEIIIVGGGDSRTVSISKDSMRMDSTCFDELSEFEKEAEPDDPQYGQISGSVHGSDGWSTFPLPFALVQAGGQSDYTNLFGNYVLNDLPLNVPLQVSASKTGWQSQSHQVTLTASNPMQVVHFVLDEDDSGGGSFNIWCESSIDRFVSSSVSNNGNGGVK